MRFASPPPGAYAVFIAIAILFASNKDKDSTMIQFYQIYDK